MDPSMVQPMVDLGKHRDRSWNSSPTPAIGHLLAMSMDGLMESTMIMAYATANSGVPRGSPHGLTHGRCHGFIMGHTTRYAPWLGLELGHGFLHGTPHGSQYEMNYRWLRVHEGVFMPGATPRCTPRSIMVHAMMPWHSLWCAEWWWRAPWALPLSML